MSDTEATQNIQYPSAETAKAMPSKEAAVGAELMYVHNVIVATVNELVDKHNSLADPNDPTKVETPEGNQNYGAINALGWVLALTEERIKVYVDDFEKVVGTDGTEVTSDAK